MIHPALRVGCRRLALSDWAFCRRLASDPVVRQASLSSQAPDFWGHAKWMWRWAVVSERIAYVLETHMFIQGRYLVGMQPVPPLPTGPIGIVRAQRAVGGGCEISIALVAEARGLGVGQRALQDLTPGIAKALGAPVFARIKSDNFASQGAFAQAGYIPAREADWQRMAAGEQAVVVLAWTPPQAS